MSGCVKHKLLFNSITVKAIMFFTLSFVSLLSFASGCVYLPDDLCGVPDDGPGLCFIFKVASSNNSNSSGTLKVELKHKNDSSYKFVPIIPPSGGFKKGKKYEYQCDDYFFGYSHQLRLAFSSNDGLQIDDVRIFTAYGLNEQCSNFTGDNCPTSNGAFWMDANNSQKCTSVYLYPTAGTQCYVDK